MANADRARDAMNWPVAASAYAAALERKPRSPDIWVQYGHALKESGRVDEAESAYRTALALDDLNADTHLQLGRALRRLERASEAMEAYVRAAELEPDFGAALDEVEALARLGVPVQGGRVYPVTGAPGETALGLWPGVGEDNPSVAEAGPALIFDVSDLLSYFRAARLPTGIQRVQIEVVRGLALDPAPETKVRVCGYSEVLDDWVEIPGPAFVRLCDRSLASGDRAAPDWLSAQRQLDLFLIAAEPMRFADHSVLINVGTSWWLQNYFLNIRRIKQAHKVLYVPFVHDMIPIMTPEHCVKQLTQDFIAWTLGVFQHADMFLVNSKATRRDLAAVAATLGHEAGLAEIEVVTLDADFRRPRSVEADSVLPPEWGLEPGGFVLLVSTIESRKDHVTAFDAWLALVEKHGAGAIPKLVCVGNPGWLNDAVHARLAASETLRAHVKIMSHLSDEELAALYKTTLFTVYPSLYEGWGLPVTESLCYGKAALISDASSLPEAGGPFADYFPAGSAKDLAIAAERLILDASYRQAREAAIAAGFAPRRWADIGAQIAAAAERLRGQVQAADQPRAIQAMEPMPARLGAFYAMSRNAEGRIWRGMAPGEMFRVGGGWRWPDDWGSWTKAPGGDLAIRIPGPHGALRAIFGIRGVPMRSCDWSLAFASPAPRVLSGRLKPGEVSWISVEFPGAAAGSDLLGTFSSEQANERARTYRRSDEPKTDVCLVGWFAFETTDSAAREAFNDAVLMNNFQVLAAGRAAD